MPRIENWNADGVVKAANREAAKRIARAGNYLQRRVRENISIPTRTHGPSKPGEFLHRDTGRLHNSIYLTLGSDGRGPWAQVGTKEDYGVYWEFAGRSFLRSTFNEELSNLRRIVSGGEAV